MATIQPPSEIGNQQMDKILIITGASKGIGHSTAALFQKHGWHIINISRSPCSITNTMNISIDLSNTDFEQTLAKELGSVLKQKSRICLIHNAAAHVNDSIKKQDQTDLTRALNVSLVSPAILNKVLIPFMAEHSSIIYIGSTLSEKAVPGAASYVIAKHATVGMMRATCQDLVEDRIHTCCICPGFTNTEMLQQHLSHDQAMLAFAKQKVGANRLIEPQEIADLLYFAAENPVINGSVMHANLGQRES